MQLLSSLFYLTSWIINVSSCFIHCFIWLAGLSIRAVFTFIVLSDFLDYQYVQLLFSLFYLTCWIINLCSCYRHCFIWLAGLSIWYVQSLSPLLYRTCLTLILCSCYPQCLIWLVWLSICAVVIFNILFDLFDYPSVQLSSYCLVSLVSSLSYLVCLIIFLCDCYNLCFMLRVWLSIWCVWIFIVLFDLSFYCSLPLVSSSLTSCLIWLVWLSFFAVVVFIVLFDLFDFHPVQLLSALSYLTCLIII